MGLDAKQFIEDIKNAGYTPRSYSGRGMYGRVCVGVELERGVSAFTFGVHLAEQMGDQSYHLGGLDVSEDSMGLDQIIYFPYVEWPADVEDDSDEDDDSDEEDNEY